MNTDNTAYLFLDITKLYAGTTLPISHNLTNKHAPHNTIHIPIFHNHYTIFHGNINPLVPSVLIYTEQ